MSRRFDYIRYDAEASQKQHAFKTLFENIETVAMDMLPDCRERALLLTALEEAYMWTGKAIRNEQMTRIDSPDVPERSDQ